MPTLTRKSFDAYKKNLRNVEEWAVRGFRSEMIKVAKGFMQGDEEQRDICRAIVADEVYRRIDTATAQAQAFADDMFEALVGLDPAPHDAFPYEAAEARTRSAAVHLFDRSDPDEFVRVLESFIRKEVRGAASAATAKNVEEARR